MNLLNALQQYTTVLWGGDTFDKKLSQLMAEKQTVLIALCGETAAGKTTLLNQLKNSVSPLAIVNADHYFCDISKKIREYGSFTKLVENGYQTESPDNFQLDVLARDLKKLNRGESILAPKYSMLDGSSTPTQTPYTPKKITIVEGICTFYEPVRDLFDAKIYLTVDPSVQYNRYLKRAAERGQRHSEIDEQYRIICAAAARYIQPNKAHADLIIKSKPLALHNRTQQLLLQRQRGR